MFKGKIAWCAKCCWKGRRPFVIGTFFTDEYDNYASAEAKAKDLAIKAFEDILPLKVPPPDSIELIPNYFMQCQGVLNE